MSISPPRHHFSGIPASPGLARGPLVVGSDVFEAPNIREISTEDVENELGRLSEGLAATKLQIEALQALMIERAGEESAAIFDAHLLMLEDPQLLKKVHIRINRHRECAEYAFHSAMQWYVNALRQIEDPYLQERTLDMEDVSQRVVRNLMGCPTLLTYDKPHVLLVHELTPSAAAAMDRSKVMALITEVGSQTSHGAIIARSMGIPAVVGVHDLANHFPMGTDCLVDGTSGEVILNPDAAALANYAVAQSRLAERSAQLGDMRALPAITLDGHRLSLGANIEFVEEIGQLLLAGSEGVGLYRTEFFYLNRKSLPTEDEQFENYRKVGEAAAPHGVIIRTLDIGGDKIHDLHRSLDESNPFLGWRGIRVSLTEPSIFKTQLRAILRASVFGHLSIMFPMISGASELRAAKAVLNECRAELTKEGIPFDASLKVGCMIEIPSAAITARTLAKMVDFFSIGTNDLIQYTIAVDRGNERVADLYQPCHPAIISLLKSVSDAAHEAGIWCGVCGEVAADISLTPLLVGLGFHELSAAFKQVPKVKYAIRKLSLDKCRELVAHVLTLSEPEQIHDEVREFALAYYPELFG